MRQTFEHFLNTATVMKSPKPLSISIFDYLKRFDSGLRHEKGLQVIEVLFVLCSNRVMVSKYFLQHPYHLNKPYVTLSAAHNNSFEQNPFYRYKSQHFLFSLYPYPYK